MAWIFANEDIRSDSYTVTGEDAAHIARSLRMKRGEELTLCTPHGRRHTCEITDVSGDRVELHILSSTVCEQEPTARVSLYVALMKGDSFDDVIQKAVELGACELTPFLSARCISRPDQKSLEKKQARWQKIADNAASQSRRGIIPRVRRCLTLDEVARELERFDRAVVCYECGGEPLRRLIAPDNRTIAIITGAEGGFEENEIRQLAACGAQVATLGKRILRARTAPIAALAATMVITGNLE